MDPFLSGDWHLSESRIITDYTDDADFKRLFIIDRSLNN